MKQLLRMHIEVAIVIMAFAFLYSGNAQTYLVFEKYDSCDEICREFKVSVFGNGSINLLVTSGEFKGISINYKLSAQASTTLKNAIVKSQFRKFRGYYGPNPKTGPQICEGYGSDAPYYRFTVNEKGIKKRVVHYIGCSDVVRRFESEFRRLEKLEKIILSVLRPEERIEVLITGRKS